MADYTFSQLEGLWIQAGGSPSLAPVMAAIALAESGGNPSAYNPSGASGLWQILGAVNPADQSSLFNPQVNAKEAVDKYNTQGLGAWVTYTSGAYKQFLPAGTVAPSGVNTTAAVTSTAQTDSLITDLTDPFKIITGIGSDIGKLISGGGSIADGVTTIAEEFYSLSTIMYTMLNDALWLFKPSSWVRIIAFGFGIGALLPGVWMLGKAGKGEGDLSLALGILLVVVSGCLLWVAFHSLPENVNSLGNLLKYISDEIRGNSPATTTPLQDQNIASAAVGVGQRQAATGNQAGA